MRVGNLQKVPLVEGQAEYNFYRDTSDENFPQE